MSTVSLTLDQIFDLAKKTLLANGCDDDTASILADLIRCCSSADRLWVLRSMVERERAQTTR